MPFIPIPRDELPRDDASQTGAGLTLRTLEHDEHNAPHAIEITDQAGRSAVYVLFEHEGRIGVWK